MKIVVGLPGTSNEAYLEELREAGADEFFVGYVPDYWYRHFGFEFSPNRRYRAAQQVTTAAHLRTLCRWARGHGMPVAMAFNEHYVSGPAFEVGRRLLAEALEAGVDSIIAADPALGPLLRAEFGPVPLQLSGDAGVYNGSACALACEQGFGRIIFPRELGFGEMSAAVGRSSHLGLEFEAFVMGEPCVFDGARCFTEHGYDFSCDFCNYHDVKVLVDRRRLSRRALPPPGPDLAAENGERGFLRLGRCGLCAIPGLRHAGITHLKVPGRSSVAVRAAKLVRAVLQREGEDFDPRSLAGSPSICASREFCYYPELAHGDS